MCRCRITNRCDYGKTPIHQAAQFERTEIVKILASLTDNPNAPGKDGITPSSVAKNAEIRKILKSFNPSRKSTAGPFGGPSKKRAKNVWNQLLENVIKNQK